MPTPARMVSSRSPLSLAVSLFAATAFAWATAFSQDSQLENAPQVEIKPITARPCLLMDSSELPEIKRRFEAIQKNFPEDVASIDPALKGLLFSDEEAKKQATEQFVTDMRTHLSGDPAEKFGPKDNSYSPLRRMRRLNEMLYSYDVVVSFGYLGVEEQREFRAGAVRAAKYLLGESPSEFPSPQTPAKTGLEFPTGYSTCNRWADHFAGPMLVGLNFPDEPMAKEWVRYGVEQLQHMLEHGNWDGTWNEVPRYHDATLRIFNPLFEALRRRTSIDFFKNPNLKPLLEWYVRFSSPLVRFPDCTKRTPDGEPTLPVWGDSNYGADPFGTLPLYATHFADTDPDFSKRLMWMWRRAGSPLPWRFTCRTFFPMLADPTLPDAAQTLGSELSNRMGLVSLRSGFDTPEETWVFLRGGSQGITHKRSDLGSIDLFSHGIPLVLGSQSGPYGEGIDWNRSQFSNNNVVFGGKSRERGECNGRIEAFFTSPQVDYAVADCSRPEGKRVPASESFQWRRHLLLVKNPDYLVVWDEISSPQPSEWLLHTTAEKFTWSPSLVTSHTAYGVDLDIHALLPSRPLVPDEREGRFGTAMPDAKQPGKFIGKSDPYPFTTLKYISIPARSGESYLTVLYPRKSDAKGLSPELHASPANGVGLKVSHGSSTDLIEIGRTGASFQRNAGPKLELPLQIRAQQTFSTEMPRSAASLASFPEMWPTPMAQW